MFLSAKSAEINNLLALKLKCIRLQHLVRAASFQSCPQVLAESSHFHAQRLSETFNCSIATSRLILKKNESKSNVNVTNLLKNATFCSGHLKLSDVIEHPRVLTLNPSSLQDRYFCLQEVGCLNITTHSILRFAQIIQKDLRSLRQEGLSFSETEHLDFYFNFVSHSTSERKILSSRLQKMYRDGSSLSKIKSAMNSEFLSSKLDCSPFKVQQIFRRSPSLQIQSLTNTDLLLNILTQKLGFSLPKICSMPSLLSLHRENVEDLLAEVPNILDINIISIIHKHPQILKNSLQNLLRIGDILRNYQITDEQLMSCPKILSFTPETIQQRLEVLCKSKDFSLLQSYKKFLWLLYHFNNLDARLKTLTATGITVSLNMFIVSNSEFQKYLCTRDSRSYMRDISFFISRVFGCTETEALQRLQEYPHSRKSTLRNSHNIVDFLLNSGVSKRQLWNGLGIVFYDVEVVKDHFKTLKTYPEFHPFSEWINHYNLMQLLMYTIEINTGFRGERMYKSHLKLEESQHLNVAQNAA